MRIIAFNGYKDGKGILIKGQLITQEYKAPRTEASWHKNLRSNIARLLSRGIPKAHVTITLGDETKEAVTNKKGFFHARFEKELEGWHKATVKSGKEQETTQVLCSTGKKGIISDVDDTFLTTHTSHTLKKLRLFLLKNAKTREAVKGMPAFYRKTRRQPFYVSSSSWELYDLIKDFCEAQDMPKGPYLLSDKRVAALKRDHHDKERRIREILQGYEDTTFILIGDDAQRDPHIYKQVAAKHPDRVEAIFIRAVNNREKARRILQGCKKPHYVELTAEALHDHYRTLSS